MPVVATFADAFIVLVLTGEYSHDDMRVAFLAALPGPQAVSGGLLIDLRHSTAIRGRSSEEVASMSRWWTHHAERFQGRLALLASGRVEFGMTRLAGLAAEDAGLTVRVFRDEADAFEWIVERHA